ncbi:MAG TPA: erythromycin esterase family protein [Polyangiaceae bacterium]|nr:erythromycin esterase family protein [Polyangiaceae bacterium]
MALATLFSSAVLLPGVSGCASPDGSTGSANDGDTATSALQQEVQASPETHSERYPIRGIHRLAGWDTSLPTKDLEPLREIIGGTEVVGLGESFHTSGGYHSARKRIIEYLIEHMGFRVLALETPRSAARSVGAYVATCAGDPTEALRNIAHVFGSTDMRDLIVWMCQWNTEHPRDPVQFVGFDMQQPWADNVELRDFFQKSAPADVDTLYGGLSTCDGIKATTRDEYYFDGGDNWPYPYAQSAFDACNRGLDAVDAYWKMHELEVVGRTSFAQLEWARIALISYRAWQSEVFYYRTDELKEWNARDTAMAEILVRERRVGFPGQKTMVWAHDGHIQSNFLGPGGEPLGGITMGTLLQRHFKDDYQAIGFVGYDVEINWPGVGVGPLPPPSPGSVEDKLHALGEQYLLVDLQKISPKFITPGKAYEVDDIVDVPRKDFRALVYLEHSPAMHALFW